MEITVSAPAKINLVLRITGRRSDGYHLLQMVNVPLLLADEITVESPVRGSKFEVRSTTSNIEHGTSNMTAGITLVCDDPHVPLDATNLCFRAAMAMREAAGRSDPIAIHLTKRIPIGAGLGGGSSDAAAVLKALNQLWGLGWSSERLAAIGLGLGADVPFFCYGRAAIVEGIGEQVQVYEGFQKLWILLINPNVNVSTKWAYEQYDFGLTAPQAHVSSLPRFFEGFEQVSAFLANDLEAVTAAHYPVIVEMSDALRKAGAGGVQMSGSGSTVFGLFATRAARDHAATIVQRSDWLLIPTESIGHDL